MTIPTIFELCTPRRDVLDGTSSDADFAADLSQVIRQGGAVTEYTDPIRFFANTYPTRGLRSLLSNVCTRLAGRSGAVAAIFRLDTTFGGGKTHGLIALVHAARGMQGVANPAEFVDPTLIPAGNVKVAAFDGENADPANGRRMGNGVLAYTPWGELAYALGGVQGYERLRKSDEEGIAPGAETIGELFGDQPALILLDELSIYLRKVRNRPGARDQLTAFLTSLFKAVEASPRGTLVYTLAVGKDGKAGDAYSDENQFIADRMAEAESVSARKATLLNPTADDETVQVLRRRLFGNIDEARAADVIEAYRQLWRDKRESLSHEATRESTHAEFVASYPLHPDVLKTFAEKTATLANFQRVRGMLRILGRTVSRLWETKPSDATAIHLHHIDPSYEPIRQEIVTRLGLSMYGPALRSDIAGDVDRRALAQELDHDHHRGMPPYTTYVARTIFIHTLAYNEPLKGLTADHLRYSMLAPTLDISFADAARQRFIEQSAYLDDRPGAPLRFLTDANLTQVIRGMERNIDPGELRAQLNDRIKSIFGGAAMESVPFPGGPWDVPDEIGNGKPLLVVLSYEGCTVGMSLDSVPDLIARIYERKGAEGGSLRQLRNNLAFIVADESRVDDMRQKVARRLALRDLKAPERLAELAEHQQAKVREIEARSETEVAVAIQQCFRHLLYPSRNRIPNASVDLAHTALDIHSVSEKPGAGQQQIVRALREIRKLRTQEDEPDAPAYIRDRTPLKRGQMTTAALRDEFRRDATLPILLSEDVFVKGIRKGVEQGEYIYQRGELLYGQGDPITPISVDEQAVVFTMAYAKDHSIWPRPAPKPAGGGAGAANAGSGQPEFPSSGTGGTSTGGFGESRSGGIAYPPGGSSAGGTSSPPPPPEQRPFSAEGLLKEALIRLWEQARARKVELLGKLTIRLFDPADAFRLLNVIGGIRNAGEKTVVFEGEYETTGGSTFALEYRGTPGDAQPLKEFLEPQLRAAKEKSMQARFEVTFTEGLAMAGDAAEKLTEQVTRFATGSAYVEATAEAKP
jgi:hypothetical protein